MFSGCTSLTIVPALNLSSVTASNNAATIFSTCSSLKSAPLSGHSATIAYASCSLNKAELEKIFLNIGAGASRTLVISTNPGILPAAVNKTSIASTAGSTTLPMANTSSIEVGMQVTGTGTPITTGRAVTFTDAGDLVNLTAHGLSDDDEVSFSVITTTTGIAVNIIYYVISAATDNFQLSDTIGGAAKALTTNGSGTIRYNTTVVTINTNTSLIMSRPMATTVSSTKAFRQLGTYKALMKGWVVTG
jgi:hypothetical protein